MKSYDPTLPEKDVEMNPKDLLNDLKQRGIAHQITETGLEEHLNSGKPLTLYVGFDPTADTLHLGNLLPLLTMKRFQNAGHRIIAVVGGATGRIGDPSGKSAERNLLDEETLQKNIRGIHSTIQRILGGGEDFLLVDNAEWTRNLSLLDFLRDVGKYFTVNHMMAKDSVRMRLEDREHGISFTEFSYMLLQAFDYQQLFDLHQCTLQLGGSDQWGNITAGMDLIRKTRTATAHGFTFPLVTKADGSKFGKSETGTVWLDAARTSPYEFYQFLFQTPDADVIRFLKLFSFKPLAEILELEKITRESPEKRAAQRALAQELTERMHSKSAVEEIEKASKGLFEADLLSLSKKDLQSLLKEAPQTRLSKDVLKSGLTASDLLVQAGVCPSKGQARRDIEGGGVQFNQRKIQDFMEKVSDDGLLHGEFVVIRKGKKNFHLVEFKD